MPPAAEMSAGIGGRGGEVAARLRPMPRDGEEEVRATSCAATAALRSIMALLLVAGREGASAGRWKSPAWGLVGPSTLVGRCMAGGSPAGSERWQLAASANALAVSQAPMRRVSAWPSRRKLSIMTTRG